MRKGKKLWFSSCILLGLLALFSCVKVYEYLTDGFNLNNITSEFAYRDHFIFPQESPQKIGSINSILHQKYSYLGKGAQTYAFLSEDKKYVLKIVKQKHHKFNVFENWFFMLPFTENWKEEKILKKRARLQNFLSSCLLCYQELPEESRLQYLHMAPTQELHDKTIIIDKLGFSYEIDLDQMEFMLQSCAETTPHKIRALVQKHDLEGAKKALQEIVDLLVRCSEKDIVDNDTAIVNNVGFVDGEAIFIDVGQIAKNDQIKDPKFFKAYMGRRLKQLNDWITSNFSGVDIVDIVDFVDHVDHVDIVDNGLRGQ